MVQKRPHGEELFEVSSKQPRHLESSDEMISSLEFPDENMPPKLHTLGEYGHFPTKSKSEYDERLDDCGGNVAELRTSLEKELEAIFPGSTSNSSWATSTTSEEDVRSEAPFHILPSPDHHDIDHHLKTVMHVGDVYSLLFDYPPWKLVPIGSDFQAEISEWDVHGNMQKSICSVDTSEALNLPSQSSKPEVSDSDDGSRFSGTCIIPMPDLNTSENNMEKVGAGRISCSCEDEGSIRCVKQHIAEAREKLSKTLGEENFVKLGFCDMGEVVAEKWSEEEELIFHEVVSGNPATLGKNFWDYLPIEFPSRTKNEIVSYYFNVFMLRKRALQNRSEPLNIDSDDDEWEGADDSAHFVIENGRECDGSAIGSPGYEDDFSHDEHHDDVHQSKGDDFPRLPINDVYEYPGDNNVICNVSKNFPCEASDNQGPAPTFLSSDQVVTNDEFYEDKPSEDGVPGTSGHDAHMNFCDNKVTSNVGEKSPLEAFDNHSSVPTFQPRNQLLSNEAGCPNVQGGECKSDNAGTAPEEVPSEKANSRKHWTGGLSGMDPNNGGQEFLLEPCSSKEWDASYLNCPRNEDFLPTCSMIEEVFGNETCNNKTNDS